MALVRCKECGNRISHRARQCPSCGAPVRRKMSTPLIGCGGIVVLGIGLLVCAGVFSRVGDPGNADNRKDPSPASLPNDDSKFPSLPEYRAFIAQPGKRSQVRAVIEKRTYTDAELKKIALAIGRKTNAPSLLIRFFDDESAFTGWDRTGTLRDADWKSWLADAVLDTNDDGELYLHRFEIARDSNTGRPRDDVLRAGASTTGGP